VTGPDSERSEAAPGPARRRPYEPPRIVSEAIFETTALACGKMPAQSLMCAVMPKNS
jgi:hypothetical protein